MSRPQLVDDCAHDDGEIDCCRFEMEVPAEAQLREVEQGRNHLIHSPRRLRDELDSLPRFLAQSILELQQARKTENRAHWIAQVVTENSNHPLAERQLLRQLLLGSLACVDVAARDRDRFHLALGVEERTSKTLVPSLPLRCGHP